MQCYQHLAATIAVSNILESFPGIRHKLPLSVIADWMDENRIEVEDVLFASTDAIKAQIEPLVRKSPSRLRNRSRIMRIA